MRTYLVIINDLILAYDTTGSDMVAPMGHHLEIQVAMNDVMLVLNMAVAQALIVAPNHAAPVDQAANRTRELEILIVTGNRNSDLHAAKVAPASAPWDAAPPVIIPKPDHRAVTAEVVPNLVHKVVDLAEAEYLVFHGDLDAVAPR